MIVGALLDAAAGGSLTFEHFKRKPPVDVRTAGDSAAVIKGMSQTFAEWWTANRARPPAQLDTYYGRQPFAVVLERTVWHVAQHVRQLDTIVRRLVDAGEVQIPRDLLAGLPLPHDVWDEELPMPGEHA